ncbi:MAG: superoxide dismutase family protein [Pseudomonadota bacterium]
MKSHNKYLTVLVSSAVILLSACGRDDVSPGNTSQSALQENTPPPVTAPASNATSEPQVEAVERISESDIIPDEYTTNNGSIDRLATVTLQPTVGNETSGMVAFIQADAESPQVRVVGKIINISPGAHGFHLHEIGNCTTPDASSAGDHFNPAGAQHAARESAVRHVGDLGNLTAQDDHTAVVDFYDEHLEFVGMNSIVGKAFIIHADEDDLTTQPSGNSGDRIACGVIENRQAVLVPE